MKLSQLECFLETAEQLNFTSAAKTLYISQPALSKQIALLEEELGVRLFIRNSRKVMLTAAGKQFQQDLKAIRKDLRSAVQRAGEIGRTDRRTVQVGCFDGKINQDFLTLFSQHIHRIDPDVRIRLQVGVFEENQIALDRGEIDIMLTLDKAFLSGPDYGVQRILKRKGVLAFRKNLFSPQQLAHLDVGAFQSLPLLLLTKQDAPIMFESTLADFKRAGINNPEIIEVKNTATLIASLEMGHGYTILSEDVVGEDSSLETFPLDMPYMETWVLAVWKKNHPVAEVLMDDFRIK